LKPIVVVPHAIGKCAERIGIRLAVMRDSDHALIDHREPIAAVIVGLAEIFLLPAHAGGAAAISAAASSAVFIFALLAAGP